jgi:hypothetical protein
VATVLASLTRLRVKVVGLVLNQVHKELSDSYYYYGYYRSYYNATDGPDKKGPGDSGPGAGTSSEVTPIKAKHQEVGA